MRDDGAMALHVITPGRGGVDLVVVEPRPERIDHRGGLQEIDVPDTHVHAGEGTGGVPAPVRGRLVVRRWGRAWYSYVMLTFASDAHRRHHPRQPFHDRDG